MEKAIIAMSGGVDSSVAALLTKEAGADCIGVMLKLYENEDLGIERTKTCCSLDDAQDARAVAYKLDMPFYVFNFSEHFHGAVIDRFIEAYRNGCTPNPCIDCNRYLKFGKLFQRMNELQRDFIVTGHYARVEKDNKSGRYLLKKGLDATKDQSYVLYDLTQEQLAHVRFPLGEYRKEDIRKIAEEHGFVNAAKPDSQDICFVPDGDYARAISRFTDEMLPPGDFVDTEGKVLGQHEGIEHYTIGQRRGLKLAAGKRIYVTDIRPSDNTVVLGKNEDLFHRELTADEVNMVALEKITEPIRVKAKIRYRHKEAPALAWQTEDGKLHLKFDEPQRAITKGQAVVLYDDDLVIGGGRICEVGE